MTSAASVDPDRVVLRDTIGVVPELWSGSGGVYQYSLSILRALERSPGLVVFSDAARNQELERLRRAGVDVRSFTPPRRDPRLLHLAAGATRQAARRLGASAPAIARRRPALATWLRAAGVSLVVYPKPMRESFETGVPYVSAIHDLQHRLQPGFPEVGTPAERRAREYVMRNAAAHATVVVADSEVGKEDLLEAYGRYGLEEDRVAVLPFAPPPYLDTAPAMDPAPAEELPARYLFYPAQFWPHKNHVALVRALGLLRREHGLDLPLVLVGSNAGPLRRRTFEEVMAVAREEGIEDCLHYLGLVPDDAMARLYGGADALVMPTFFGPTNIPILEAWALGVPVVTSDLRGIREQVGEAGLLADPSSPEALADAVRRVLTDEALRGRLILRGHERHESYTASDFRERLLRILDEALARCD
jgi:glycosyltransferase involved in cell wall biosynthesis